MPPEDDATAIIKAQHELIVEMMGFIGSMVLQDYGKLNDTLVASSAYLREAGVEPAERKKPNKSAGRSCG